MNKSEAKHYDVRKFRIEFTPAMFDDLRERIDRRRPHSFRRRQDWSLGTPDGALEETIAQWRDYDWNTRRDYLNQFPQYTCEINGVMVHFFHIRSERRDAVPVLMAHGWPDSFLRYADTFPLLADFDLIVPSLPGFGFSSLPDKGFAGNAGTAEIWHILMTEVLGYERYAATGGDMGRGALMYLAAGHPDEIIGLHLTDVGFAADIVATPDEKLSPDFLRYKKDALQWMRLEGAYINIQSTKPYSLGYGLCDSPAGMAAWLLEKYHDWSDWEHFDIRTCWTASLSTG